MTFCGALRNVSYSLKLLFTLTLCLQFLRYILISCKEIPEKSYVSSFQTNTLRLTKVF